MPFIPHIASECLSELEGKKFYSKNRMAVIDKSLLEENNVTIVVQINGKKGPFIAKKDIGEKEAVLKAKDIENIKKNLSNKKIMKEYIC